MSPQFDIRDPKNRYLPCPRCQTTLGMCLERKQGVLAVVCTKCSFRGPGFVGYPSHLQDRMAFEAWNALNRWPDNPESSRSHGGDRGDARSRFDNVEGFAKHRPLDQYICDRRPGEWLLPVPTWGDLVDLVESRRELEAEVDRLRSCLRTFANRLDEIASGFPAVLPAHSSGPADDDTASTPAPTGGSNPLRSLQVGPPEDCE